MDAPKNVEEISAKKKTILARIKARIRLIYGKTVVDLWKKIQAQPFFMNMKNKESKEAFQKSTPVLSIIQKRVLADLERDGLALAHLDEFFPNENTLSEIKTYIEREFADASLGRNKKFLTFLWNNAPTFTFSNPLARLALRKEFIDTVNAYIGLFSRFAFFSLNRTVVVTDHAAAEGSQRWHRDPALGDERMVKIFMYVNDVLDDGTGPFTFVKGSHRTGKWGNFFKAKQPEGIYPPPGAVENTELNAQITPCFGKAGTLVFCDTTGLHKGGYSKTKERIMSTFYYVSPGSLQKPNFTFADSFAAEKSKLSELELRTLGLFGR